MLYKELISHLLLAFAIKRLEIEVDEIQTPAKDGLKHALKSLGPTYMPEEPQPF